MTFSAFTLLKEAVWPASARPHWRDRPLRKTYDYVVIGGGGHGLATAYYLAKNHRAQNIAVLEKNWLGSGNVGRNTTIVRSNYLLDENVPFYEFSLRLWERLSQELGYNLMFSQRGVLNLFHSDAGCDEATLRGNRMRRHGADAELLSERQLRKKLPFLNYDAGRFPIRGGLLQRRAGTARHDALAWGYARAASRLGVDLIQQCEVLDFQIHENRVQSLETTLGPIRAEKIGLAVAGRTSLLARKLGLCLPIESHVLQACVTEGLKPFLDLVLVYGAGHFYISQSDKGGLVFGGDLDGYNSYAMRGNLATIQHVVESGVELVPGLSRVHLLRHWGGVMDMSMDGSPVIDRTPLENVYLNAGWCYGGFKATPASGWCFAHLLAHDTGHELAQAYRLDRFKTGALIDEKGVGATPNLH